MSHHQVHLQQAPMKEEQFERQPDIHELPPSVRLAELSPQKHDISCCSAVVQQRTSDILFNGVECGDFSLHLKEQEYTDAALSLLMKLFENSITTNLNIHVQHGCNKLLRQLPLTSTHPSIFERYMDRYLPFAKKSKKYFVMIRDAERRKAPHIEYRFDDKLPSFGNTQWCIKRYSCLLSDSSEMESKNAMKQNLEFEVEDCTNLVLQQKYIEFVEKNKNYVRWQHMTTCVQFLIVRCNIVTGMVTCTMKLQSFRLTELDTIISCDNIIPTDEGWLPVL